jgi:alkaline phosphatase
MGVYADSSPDLYDDPKVETVVELLKRIWGSAWGAVSTAFLADATPIALTAHTRSRYAYGPLIDQALHGVTNYSWTNHGGPDAYFGGGAEQFLPGSGSYLGKDYYAEFAKQGYALSLNKTSLAKLDNFTKALGVFCKSNLPVWLDRNVFPNNLKNQSNDPAGGKAAATDLPGLKEMTLKAVDILHRRGGDKGFFLMAEAASIDKQMHVLDYDRALGDLLELDDTVQATIAKLKVLDELDNTLIVVTADHGHGFDVFGNADTKYLAAQKTDRKKRDAIGVYQNSGLSQYTVEVPGVSYGTGASFPVNWDPRYVIAAGLGANPDHRENYRVNKNGSRLPAVAATNTTDYYVNPADNPDGFVVKGTLPTNEAQGVHSLTDVPLYALGPCQEAFGGTYSNIEVFYKIADCLGLAHGKNTTSVICSK